MRRFNNAGYTLLELMITILIGSIITLATTTVLLLGLRLNNESQNTVTKQNTARIVMAMLEDMATEGTIKKVNSTATTWEIIGQEESGSEKVLLSYNAEKATIYTGPAADNSPLFDDVTDSYVTLQDNKLLSFAVEVEDEGLYASSVYCRKVPVATKTTETLVENILDVNTDIGELDTEKARIALLKNAASQYGSGGVILSGDDFGRYFSQWYIGDNNFNTNGWNKDTPWCACFVSWVLEQTDDYIGLKDGATENDIEKRVPKYSSVDDYVKYFQDGVNGSKWEIAKDESYNIRYTPKSGDLIIFDWKEGGETGPDHIGFVLKVENDKVFTIEGNTGNRVAVRDYNLGDEDILGYGILKWKTDTEFGGVDASKIVAAEN